MVILLVLMALNGCNTWFNQWRGYIKLLCLSKYTYETDFLKFPKSHFYTTCSDCQAKQVTSV